MAVSMKRWVTGTALCITALLMSASAESADIKKPETLVVDSLSYYFSIEIMNRVYNDSLQDSNSPDYKRMFNEVSGAVLLAYGCPTCPNNAAYQGVTDMNFRKGSVIADFIVLFKGSFTNPVLLKFVFLSALSSNNEINGLIIKPTSVQDSYVTTTTSTPTTSTTATTTTTTTTPTTTTTTPTTTATTTTPTTTTTTTPTTTATTTTPTTTTTTTTTPTTTTTTTTPTTTPTTITTPTTTTTTTTPTTTTTTPTTITTPTTTTRTTTTPKTRTPKTPTTMPDNTSKSSEQSSSLPIFLPTHASEGLTSSRSITTSNKSSTITISSHSIGSSSIHTRGTNSSSTSDKDSKTSNPPPYPSEGVPGWAIALLVLAAIAILLLIIIIIILLVRWCCVDSEDDVRSLPPQEHTPYMRTTFREPLSVPAYSPHTPQKNVYPFDDLPQSPKPKPPRTGTYVVNPER
ncbi:uncharacterized protein Hap1MRO34_002391 [Clarias gariepinus]|uniref:uncharacterized protein LOC128515606 n=1 Tax=Clarias gariepinus TaxID=13013 RepID=UPI00234D5815|nr:uncharacterized protein LOC128515606 [Clarias gariepinus]